MKIILVLRLLKTFYPRPSAEANLYFHAPNHEASEQFDSNYPLLLQNVCFLYPNKQHEMHILQW